MIVAIDGPAGAGKSSVAHALARRLGFRFLDTGAMYRAVVWAALEAGTPLSDASLLAALAVTLKIDATDGRTVVNGRDISAFIRTARITELIHYAADNVAVRVHLNQQQRAAAQQGSLVTEGRDQGTDVFPHAECKIFLTASPEERARRRILDLAQRGEAAEYAEVLAAINARDARDRSRPVGRLLKAADAIEVITDGLSPDAVVDRLEAIVRGQQPA